MALDVKVIIVPQKQVRGTGFSTPLLFTGMADSDVPYTECTTLEEVEALFAKKTPTYIAAKRILDKSLSPVIIAVCASTGNALSALPNLWKHVWRQLVLCSAGIENESSIADVGEYLQNAEDRVLYARIKDLDEVKGGGKTIAKLDRIFCLYYPDPAEGLPVIMPEASVVGVTAGKVIGSITYKNQIISDIEPLDIDDALLTQIHKAGCYTIVGKAGDTVTSEGKVSSGEYLDAVDGKDWVIKTLEYRTQKALNQLDKVAYDNNGIAQLEAICVGVLTEASANGIIDLDENDNYAWFVKYGLRGEARQADITARKYMLGKFTFKLSGAVHEATINGTLIV